ncbi:putative F-box domain-containing protein [Helianthus annuus]|nr:putative F-box domain-containing protein [Helianthus annuus]KAJ0584536.1 putative F-box domain-containing protein [Helianthus annuus]KAJ0747149.1 putative F-box domain-containing protein [Helianthus annuus]KAJ0750200.1 putative F-box domain-containing protein [Helianthus annuus]
METLEDEQSDDRSAQKAKNSFPEEIIEDILSRLPVKSILRFKSVSKPWLSLISAPSFHNLHSTVAPRTTAFFFTARDSSTGTRYFFSGANDGGSVANLMKLDNTVFDAAHNFAEHLKGLVCFTSRDSLCGKLYAFVFNPTTHKFFKLPDPPVPLRNYTDENKGDYYLFGFDELSNEHKVLYIDVESIKPTTIEIMIFSFSNYSWRKIEVDLPLGISAWRCFMFSIINMHPEAVTESICPDAQFVKINGLIGVACFDTWIVDGRNKMDIWMLQDYQNQVWVRETIWLASKSWIRYGEGDPYPSDSINMDEIIFSPRVLSENLISVPIYNMKARCFKSIELTLGHRFLSPKSVRVEEIKCYVESLIPLQN